MYGLYFSVCLTEALMGKGGGVICKMPIIFELQRKYLRRLRSLDL